MQRLCIEDVLDGHDVLVQSPTGSGKTLAFGVPLVDRVQAEARRPAALVLAPTRELAEQIVDETRSIAQSRALKVAPVFGGVGIPAQARKAAQAHIVVATPGRLEDLIQRRMLTLEHVHTLVLDEADRMLDMGFKPAVDRIVAQIPSDRQTLFFSATLEGAVGKLAAAYTRNARSHSHKPDDHGPADIEHRFVHLSHEGKLAAWSASCATPSGAALWSSSAPSAAPTGSSRSSRARSSTRSRCTATRARTSAVVLWRASRAATARRSSRPTSPRAGSTWRTSRT